jgi:hypothetical protein
MRNSWHDAIGIIKDLIKFQKGQTDFSREVLFMEALQSNFSSMTEKEWGLSNHKFTNY